MADRHRIVSIPRPHPGHAEFQQAVADALRDDAERRAAEMERAIEACVSAALATGRPTVFYRVEPMPLGPGREIRMLWIQGGARA